MRGARGLRCLHRGMAELHRHLGNAALGRARAHGGRARVHAHEGRRVPLVDLPAVHPPFKACHALVVGRHLVVQRPACDAQPALAGLHLGLDLRIARRTQRGGVDVGQVSKVQQVVHDELHVRLVVDVARLHRPLGAGMPEEAQDAGRVGLLGLAHPDPHEAVALHHGVSAHARHGRNALLARHLHAHTLGVELQAVVQAAHAVAFLAADGQRRRPVAAPVVHRHHTAVFAAVEQQGLA